MQTRQKINYRKISISVTLNKIYFKNHFKTWLKVFLLRGSGIFFSNEPSYFLFLNISVCIDFKKVQVGFITQ